VSEVKGSSEVAEKRSVLLTERASHKAIIIIAASFVREGEEPASGYEKSVQIGFSVWITKPILRREPWMPGENMKSKQNNAKVKGSQ
jgi:hypothetical protein